MSESRTLTIGELLVGKTFNPSGDERVDRLKELFAEAIDILDTVESDGAHVDSYVEHTLNKIIDVQMASVKCLFLK